jgi:hypothetical protein
MIIQSKLLINMLNYYSSAIIIQKNIKKWLIKRKILIPSSFYQTKTWRKNRNWYKNGKFNECEKYQINLIEKILKNKISKTPDRINIETLEICSINHPMLLNNGYEYTENFDGKYKNVYFNLKFICDNGGAQTRTLREVYHFIKSQMEFLIKKKQIFHFINILDGDTSFKNMDKFHYLKSNKKYKDIIKYIFIGDLHQFQNHFQEYIQQ